MSCDLELAHLSIAHDLGVVRHFADRVAVMRAGKLIEDRMADEPYDDPREGYAKTLLAAVPIPDLDVMRRRRNAAFPAGAGLGR